MHGNHVGQMRIADNTHGKRQKNHGNVQEVPLEGNGFRRKPLPHTRNRLLRFGLPALRSLVRPCFRSITQHERIASCAQRQKACRQHGEHARLVSRNRECRSCHREQCRSNRHNGGEAPLQATEIRVAPCRRGNRDGEHFSAPHKIRRCRHEKPCDRKNRHRSQHNYGCTSLIHVPFPCPSLFYSSAP